MERIGQTVDQTQLVNLARRGDKRAIEQVIDLFAPRLFGLLYRMTGSRTDAEDLLQETFIKMLRGLPNYNEDGRFEPWLFSIAGNVARDLLRRRRRSPAAAGSDQDDDAQPSHAAADPGPDQVLVQAEQVDLLQQAIEGLSPAEREMISLRFFSQMSFKEIAERLQVPLGTALARAHRALGHLRQRMDSHSSAPTAGHGGVEQ